MKGKKEDKMLRALFRQKLENAEILPSPAVSTDLMRKLRRREFLHFIPTRFNIWYAAGITAAAAALGLILFSGSGRSEKSSTASIPVNPVSSSYSDIQKQEKESIQAGELYHSEKDGEKTEPADNKKTSVATVNRSVKKNLSSPKVSEESGNNINPPPERGITVPDPVVEKEQLRGIVKMADYRIESSLTEGCVPLKVHFKSVTPVPDSCLWSFGDGGYSSLKSPDWLFDVPGEYKVTLQVFSNSGLQSENSVNITVFPKPVARFEISPENAVLPDDEITFHNFSADAVRFIWNFGDGGTSSLFEPKYQYKSYGNYDIFLIAISEHGCRDSVLIQNAFSGSGFYIDFPNAFIPNPTGPSSGYFSQKSDESSQVFHPVFNGVSDYQLRIFSRRGILIFESNDINVGWDGYFKGQLCEPGVYVWKVRGGFMNGEPFTKMGDVTLLKN